MPIVANMSDILGNIGDAAVLGNFTNVAGNGSEPLVLEFTDSNGNMSEIVTTRFLILAVPPKQLSPKLMPTLKPLTDWNVFVAGEAYYFPRMYLESDFRSAEELLQVYFFEKPQVSQYDANAVIIVGNRMRIGSSMSVSSDGAKLAAVSYGDDGGDVTVFQYHGDPRVGKWSPIGEGFTTDYKITHLRYEC